MPSPKKNTDRNIEGSGASDPSGAPRRGRRRGCFRWAARLVIGGALLLVVGLLWLNGPGFRWLATRFGGNWLRDQGVEASFRVGGTLWGGPELRDVSVVGDEGEPALGIRRLELGRAALRYAPARWLDGGWMAVPTAVEMADAVVEIDLPAKTAAPDEEKEADDGDGGVDFEKLRQAFDRFWDLLAVRVELRNVTARIRRGDHDVAVIESLDLVLPGIGEGVIEAASVSVPPVVEIDGLAARTEVDAGHLRLRDLALEDDLAVASLEVHRAGDRFLEAEVEAFGGGVLAVLDGRGAFQVDLGRGEIDLDALLARFGIEIEELVAGRVAGLHLASRLMSKPPIEWPIEVEARVVDARWRHLSVDAARASVSMKERALTLEAGIEGSGASIELTGTGDASGAEGFADLAQAAGDLKADFKVGELGRLLPEGAVNLTGAVDGTADLRVADRAIVAGRVEVESTTLAYSGTPVDLAAVTARADSPDRIDLNARIGLDDENRATLEAALLVPNGDWSAARYDGKLDLEGSASPRVAELLSRLGMSEAIEGRVTLGATGNGPLAASGHQGSAEVTLRGGGFRTWTGVDAELRGSVEPDSLAVDSLEVRWEAWKLALEQAGWDFRDLVVGNLLVEQSGDRLLDGRVRLPLTSEAARDPKAFFGQSGPVDVVVTLEPVGFARIGELTGRDLGLEGSVGSGIRLQGTLSDLAGEGSILVDGLKPAGNDRVPAAKVAAGFRIVDDRLRLDGSVTHPHFEPFTLAAAVPFTPGTWAENGFDPEAFPLEASLRASESSLEFVKEYAPVIAEIDGRFAADVKVGGTAARPVADGRLTLTVAELRIDHPMAPSIRDAKGAITFDQRIIRIEEIEAVAAGGFFRLAGSVDLSDSGRGGEGAGGSGGFNPVLDLELEAREALVARSADYNVRTNGDLRVAGPWKTAAVSGRLGLTGSRYAKFFELMPLDFGRTRVEVPEIDRPEVVRAARIVVGTDAAPFRDWTVDLKVGTDDPFLVRTNFGRADVMSDIAIGGTGADLIPSGRVWLEEASAKLPFSRIDVTQGELLFNEASRFNPEIDVKATSRVGDIDVRIFAFGLMTRPGFVMTSSPPMPQEEIISLLSTGVTRNELAHASGTVALSRAAILALKEISPRGERPTREGSLRDAIERRVSFDGGRRDPQTGETMLGGRIRLWKDLSFSGSMGLQGDYRALFRYVFKFR